LNISDSLMRSIATPGGTTPVADVVRAIIRSTGRKHHPRDVMAQLKNNYNVSDGVLIGWSLT